MKWADLVVSEPGMKLEYLNFPLSKERYLKFIRRTFGGKQLASLEYVYEKYEGPHHETELGYKTFDIKAFTGLHFMPLDFTGKPDAKSNDIYPIIPMVNHRRWKEFRNKVLEQFDNFIEHPSYCCFDCIVSLSISTVAFNEHLKIQIPNKSLDALYSQPSINRFKAQDFLEGKLSLLAYATLYDPEMFEKLTRSLNALLYNLVHDQDTDKSFLEKHIRSITNMIKFCFLQAVLMSEKSSDISMTPELTRRFHRLHKFFLVGMQINEQESIMKLAKVVKEMGDLSMEQLLAYGFCATELIHTGISIVELYEKCEEERFYLVGALLAESNESLSRLDIIKGKLLHVFNIKELQQGGVTARELFDLNIPVETLRLYYDDLSPLIKSLRQENSELDIMRMNLFSQEELKRASLGSALSRLSLFCNNLCHCISTQKKQSQPGTTHVEEGNHGYFKSSTYV